MDTATKARTAIAILGLPLSHDAASLHDALKVIILAAKPEEEALALELMADALELTATGDVGARIEFAQPGQSANHAAVRLLSGGAVDVRDAAFIVAGSHERHIWRKAIATLREWVEGL